jgi:hypothetical protein
MTPHDRIQAAIIPTDAVARAAELRWGVCRLESLVSAVTITRWREGWSRYCEAIRTADADGVERLAPKIAQAIRAMEAEAEAAGHAPLSPTAWEAPLADGRVLVVTRTFAEAHALSGSSDGREGGGVGSSPDPRERVVWTMEELANVLPTLEVTYQAKVHFPGARVKSTVQRSEGYAHDWSQNDMLELHDPKVAA